MKHNIFISKGILKKTAVPVLLSMIVCLSGCGAEQTAEEKSKVIDGVQVIEETFDVIEDLPESETEPDEEFPVRPGEPEEHGYPISTMLGELEFPAEWAECIRVSDESTNEMNSIGVYGTAEEKEALLFTINFGAGEEGFLFGSAPDAQGKMTEVRIVIEDFVGDETWSDTAVEQIVNMQSRVNDIIEQIYALPGFVRAQ